MSYMTKGLKIWLWVVLVLNGFAVLGNVMALAVNASAVIYIALNLVVVSGIVLLLFKQKKLGLYLYAGCAVIGLVLNIVLQNSSNLIASILMAFVAPGITYLLMRKTWNEFQ